MPMLRCGAEMRKLMDVSDEDVQVIEETLAERLAMGIDRRDAERQAVNEALAQLKEERQAVLQAIKEQHPEEQKAEPVKEVVEAAKPAADEPKRNEGKPQDDDGTTPMFPKVASEPQSDYAGGYETDLFGEPLPGNTGKDRPAKSGRAGLRGDAQRGAVSDTPIPTGEFYVNTVVGTQTQRELGAARVETPQQAAQATRYLYKSAVERFDAIVTDKDHKPIAVVGGFKGAVSQASVYPGTIVGEAVRIPGAAHIWFSHNHPSGNPSLSRADEALNATLTDVFKGSGIKPMGTMAVAGDQFTHVDAGGDIQSTGDIGASDGSVTVPVVERELGGGTAMDVVTSPSDAMSVAATFYKRDGGAGIIMMNAQNRVVAWVPISKTMTGPLRDTGGLSAIYRAVSQSNTASAIIVHGGELSLTGNLPAGRTAIENIAAALQRIEVRTLDAIDAVKNYSLAEAGLLGGGSGPLFKRESGPASTGMSRADFRAAMVEAWGPKVADRLEQRGVVVPLEDQNSLPDHVVPFVRDGDIVYGFYDKKTDRTYAVLSNMKPRMVKGLTMHEVGVHYGFEAMLGKDKYNQVIDRLAQLGKIGHKNVIAARDSATKNSVVKSQIPEETLAYMVQNHPDMPLIAGVIAQIRAWLFKTFGIGGKNLTTADITALAHAAVLHASRTQPGERVPSFANNSAFNKTGDGKITPSPGESNDSISARQRLEANRSTGAHAAWWVEDQTEFIQSTGKRRLDSVARQQVIQTTLDGRKNSVKTRREASVLEQIESRAGFCFKTAAEASANGIGDMVIGATHDPEGNPIWHAVVMRDDMVYDPTFGRWFEPGVFESLDFAPTITLTVKQVQDHLERTRGWAPNPTNQGLNDTPDYSRGTTESMASRKDVVGESQGGRSADDEDSGAGISRPMMVDPAALNFREPEQNRKSDLTADTDVFDPIVVIDDGGDLSILDGHNRASVALDRGDDISAVKVTQEEYDRLLEKGFDDGEIAWAALQRANQSYAAGNLESQFPGAGIAKGGDKAWDELLSNESTAPNSDGASMSRAPRTIEVNGVRRPIENSKGQPIIVNHDTQKLKNFYRWFGDSAVKDEQGRPLVVYHGTPKGDVQFAERDRGLYFTSSTKQADGYTYGNFMRGGREGAIYPVYLSMQNPMIIDAHGKRNDNIPFPGVEWKPKVFGNIPKGAVNVEQAYRRAIAAGHDGLIVRNVVDTNAVDGREKGDVYVAQNPNQIKSATGNNGDFSPENADIRFSRADYLKPALDAVASSITAPGTVSWWDKTVGTPYHLAQRHPAFKKVFDRVQEFLGDVSAFATEAADKAPTILPKLESWKDITKTAMSAADTKAVGRPVWEGTLLWTRDESGKPVKMADLEAQADTPSAKDKADEMLRRGLVRENILKMWQGLPIEQYEAAINTRYANTALKAGIVWSDAELKSQFNLNPAQIALYREFRAATDQSISNLALSDMLRYAGDDAREFRAKVLKAPDLKVASEMLRDHLLEIAELDPERSAVLTATADKIINKADQARDLMAAGYAPLMRFGQYTVDVVHEGQRVYFGLFEGKLDAAKMAKQMEAEYPGATITRGTVSQEEYKLFAGVSPETLELFGEMLGLESTGDAAKDKAFQEYIKLAKSNRSSMKRLIHRKGIAGFNEDVGRVLAGFVYSNARQTAANLHMGEITEAANEIPQGQGQLKDAAVKLADYVKNPQEEAQQVRGLLFAQYLGGSLAAAMVNMTQPIQVTMPYLSQFGGIVQSAKQMKNAVADVWKKSTGDADLDAALKHAVEQGIVAPQEVHQLMAQASGRGSLKSGDGTRVGDLAAMGNNAAARLALAWGKFFSSAELFNRRVTFIAAYRIAKAQNMENPAAFAEKAINETQFVYNKGNRPNWARGAIGSTLFTFKTYSISYLELMHRMYYQGGPEGRKAALFGLAMLMLMGGAGGLPFMEDLDDVVDGIGQRMGYNFSLKRSRQQLLRDVLGKQLGEFMDKGVSGLPGAPIDISGRLGMGNLIPGTGIFLKKTDHTRDVLEILGPAGDFAKRVAEGVDLVTQGKPIKGVMSASPTASRNLAQAWDMATTGQYRDKDGRKVLDTDGMDALVKAIGFQPTDVARVQEASRDAQSLIAVARMRESEIVAEWARAMVDHDTAGQQAARDAIRQWNIDNPDTPIKVKPGQVLKKAQNMRMSKAERIEKSAPKEVRAAARRELEQAN